MGRRGSWAVLVATVVALTGVTTPASAVAGNQLWAERYLGTSDFYSYSVGSAIALSPDGGTVYVTGVSVGPDGLPAATVAYRSDGTMLWARRYGRPDLFQVSTGSIRVSPDGSRVFVAGTRQVTQNSSDLLVISYDGATGTRLWARHFRGPSDSSDFGGTLAISPDGNRVFVGGTAAPATGGYGDITLAFDAATGTRLWVSRFAGRGVADLVLSPDGATVYVTGSENALTIAYDAATGARKWKAVLFNPYGWTIAHRIAISPDGSQIFVAAAAESSDSDTDLSDYMTVAYDAATGHQQWSTRYDSPHNRYDTITGIAVAGDGGRVFVTGLSDGGYVSLAYDATTGTQQWKARYTSGERGQDTPSAIAVGPDGVFVTGASPGPVSSDVATVAYNPATGAQLWVSRYNGPDDLADGGAALVVDPAASRLYVVGSSARATNNDDMVTIAYDTKP
jgi:outer membrane protein assembly factor BamB